MPFALVAIGIVMIVTGINNCYASLGTQLKADFTGSKNFVIWIVAIGSVGALGYIKDFREFSHYFMALILVALVLSNQGFFSKLSAAIAAGPVAAPGTGQSTSATNTGINAPSAIDLMNDPSKLLQVTPGSWLDRIAPTWLKTPGMGLF